MTTAPKAHGKRAAQATRGEVADVAREALDKGNAVDAVVAGVFAAAALAPQVLLGPVQLLVGGAGAGLRAVDGRTRQAGKKLPRPRGFLREDEVPPAAKVGVPLLPAALAAALASFGTASVARAVGPAREIARALSEPRADLLSRIGRRGAAALTDAGVVGELVAACGRVAGGVLGEADLKELLPAIVACKVQAIGARKAATVPWGSEAVRSDGDRFVPASNVEVVAVADARGLLAIACYGASEEGLGIDALGLVAPFTAEPVRRGQTRVTPGEAREAPAPIALSESEGLVDIAVAITGAEDAEARLHDVLQELGQGALLDAIAAEGAATVSGVARSREGARAFARRAGS